MGVSAIFNKSIRFLGDNPVLSAKPRLSGQEAMRMGAIISVVRRNAP